MKGKCNNFQIRKKPEKNVKKLKNTLKCFLYVGGRNKLRCWVLGAGCWVLGAGCWVPGAGLISSPYVICQWRLLLKRG
jgi:hypothetical protein